jgi:HSP20 family protein
MDDIVNEIFSDFSLVPSSNTFISYIDVIENDKEYRVELMVSGFKKEDVKVSVEKNCLTIKGERKEDKSLQYNTKRSFFGTFEKNYELPEYVDKENINASLENGVLTITIPKTKDADSGTKVIEIK